MIIIEQDDLCNSTDDSDCWDEINFPEEEDYDYIDWYVYGDLILQIDRSFLRNE